MIKLNIRIQLPAGTHVEDKDYLAHRLKDVLQHDVTQVVQGFAPQNSSAIVDVTLITQHPHYAAPIHPNP